MPIYPWDIAPKSSAYITTLVVKVFVIDLRKESGNLQGSGDYRGTEAEEC